jgi:hypothetical protein
VAGANLVSALFYLRTRSLQNLLVSRFRRLKQPKYLVGAVIGIAYLYFVFGRRFMGNPRPGRGPSLQDFNGDGLPLVPILGAAGLLVFIALCWVLRRARAALNFTEAEIAFLFPAPASRQALIHYRLIGMAAGAAFTALILGLVSGPWPGVAGSFGMRYLGWWLVFVTLSLHTMGSAFTITRWLDRGYSALRCQLIAAAVLVIVVGLPLAWLWRGLRAGTVSGIAALQEGPVAWLLLPFRLLLEPLLATDGRNFVLALLPALAICAVHYLWVLRVQVGFEEASIARAEKRAATVAAMRAGNFRFGAGKQKARRAPFNLGGAGRPELAFMWKNLLSTAEYLRLRNLLIAAALIVAACTWFSDSGFYNAIRAPFAMVAVVIAAYTLLLGPQLARQDFRSDLHNTDILKTYPLRGWQIMLGEMLTPLAVLTGILWLMLLAAALLVSPEMRGMAWLTQSLRIAGALVVALFTPLLCMLQLVIVNAAAVLLPAWQPGPGRPQQGIEVMGQRMLFLAGQMIAVVVILLPAAIVAAIGFAATRWMVGNGAAAAVAAALAAVMLAVEIGLAIVWLGQRFEKLDLSQELRA